MVSKKVALVAGWNVKVIYQDGEVEEMSFDNVEELNDMLAAGTSDEAYQFEVGINAYFVDEQSTGIQVDSWSRQA